MKEVEKKIPVGLLGATGAVGQKFVELLQKHPFFDLVFVAASSKSSGQAYGERVHWQMPTPLKKTFAALPLQPCDPLPKFLPRLVFSALDSDHAQEIEANYAKHCLLISSAKNFRMDEKVPLIIPEVNASHLDLLQNQDKALVCNPNCNVVGLCLALKPLLDEFGLEAVHVNTMQAISGAGFKNLPAFKISDNVVPFIPDEEDKIEKEPLKIFGALKGSRVHPYQLQIEANCSRVNVSDGHTLRVSVRLKKKANLLDVLQSFQNFSPSLALPSAPKKALYVFSSQEFPQPRLHRDLEEGMAVSVGGIKPSTFFDYTFHVVVHNTLRGAAGGAILTAELMRDKSFY